MLQEAIQDLKDEFDESNNHVHFSNVSRYWVANYGSDDNPGTQEAPFRTLIPLFDPENPIVNKKDTIVRVHFLTNGTFQCFKEYQEWPWYSGCFLRFTGPTRTTMPASSNDLPNVWFNAKAVNMNNCYLAFDYCKVTVGTGQYDPELGQAYNRMHLNNTSLICKMAYFNESKHAPHCAKASYEDCVFNSFAASNSLINFSHNNAITNDYVFTTTQAPDFQAPLWMNASLIAIEGQSRLKQPDSNIALPLIYNHASILFLGGDIRYHGTGTGKYRYGIQHVYGQSHITTDRLNALQNMGYDGNTSSGINMYVTATTYLDGGHVGG